LRDAYPPHNAEYRGNSKAVGSQSGYGTWREQAPALRV
jgi:hypothetical protein